MGEIPEEAPHIDFWHTESRDELIAKAREFCEYWHGRRGANEALRAASFGVTDLRDIVRTFAALSETVAEWYESGQQVAHYNQCSRVGDTIEAGNARYRRMRDAEQRLTETAAALPHLSAALAEERDKS